MATKQMKQLKELLQSAEVRRKIRAAKDEGAAIKAVQAAGRAAGLRFADRWVKLVFEDVKLAHTPFRLSELDLVSLAGRGSVGDTAPKLCHTDSCGGGHAGCC